MMFFLGCHLTDLILQIMGTPKNIIALNRSANVEDIDAQDFGMAVFEYENGVSFAKTSAIEIGGYARRQLVVSGTKGTIEIKPLEMYGDGGLYSGMCEWKDADWGGAGESKESEIYDRYESMMAGFAGMVRGEKENPWSYDYELELYKTVLNTCGRKI